MDHPQPDQHWNRRVAAGRQPGLTAPAFGSILRHESTARHGIRQWVDDSDTRDGDRLRRSFRIRGSGFILGQIVKEEFEWRPPMCGRLELDLV